MLRSRLFALAFGASLIAGCIVEPPSVEAPQDAAVFADASTVADAGRHDAGASCLAHQYTCPSGTYCTASDVCAPVPTKCATTGDCAPGWSCTRGGACLEPHGSCRSAADCTGVEVCTAAGWCAPPIVAVSPIVTGCHGGNDCGPAGICEDGRCVACSATVPCPGSLICSAGACLEATSCSSADQCFSGNSCVGHTCTRATETCTHDAANDTSTGAAALTYVYRDDTNLCGIDVDYYTLAVEAGAGALVAVTSTRAETTVEVGVTTAAGGAADTVAALRLPGLTVLGVPVGNAAQSFIVSVKGLDTSGKYGVDVKKVAAMCGDALDLYGDGDPSTAPLAPPESTLSLVACPNDEDDLRVDLDADDALHVAVTMGSTTAADVDVELLDDTGTVIGAGHSTSTSTEAASTPPLSRAERVTVRVLAKQAPSAGAKYTLELTRTLGARKRACDAPVATITQTSSRAVGSLAGATNLGAPLCDASFSTPGRHDQIVAVVPPAAPALLKLTAKQVSGSATATLSVALLDGCLDDASVLACAASPRPYHDLTISHMLETTAPTYVMISSDGPAEDVDWQLDASFRVITSPSNDTCAHALGIAGSTPAGSPIDATNLGATNDAQLETSGICGNPGDGSGPDTFYRLSLEASQRAAIELLGPIGGYLWVTTSCDQAAASCVAADKIDGALPAKVVLSAAAATNYVVVADGVGAGSVGEYQLRVVRPPELECVVDSECPTAHCDDYRCAAVPANDRCPGTPVVFVNDRATIGGSTGAASDNYAPDCVFAPGGADVVYSVSVPTGVVTLNARITSAAWDPILMIRYGDCASAADEIACNDDVGFLDGSYLPEVSVARPAAGTYSIIVDSAQGKGPFTLELELVR